MLEAAVNGYLVAVSLILAIGAQNAFVLRQGLRREHVAAVVAVCALSDAVLIAAGVAGFGSLSAAVPWFGASGGAPDRGNSPTKWWLSRDPGRRMRARS